MAATNAAVADAGDDSSSMPAAEVAKSSLKAPIASVSSNWSGYAASAPANSVSYVAGSWVVPTASPTTNGYSSVWVGIDGYNSSTVEQLGTEADVANGTVTYYTWYEMYPSASVAITGMMVKPGDSITASVTYNAAGNDFVLSMVDTTQSKTFTKSFLATGEARSSAEWIVEAPSSNSGILPLANFGSTTFTDAYATINGTTGAIDNSAWQLYAINLQTRSQVMASTGSLSDVASTAATYTGMASSFTVTYAAASTGTGTGTGTSPTPRPHGWGGWGRSGDSGGWSWVWRQPDVLSQISVGSSDSLSVLTSRNNHAARDQFFASSELSLDLLDLRV